MNQTLQNASEFEPTVSSGFNLIYMSHDNCSVCKALRPKIEELLHSELQSVDLLYIDLIKFPEIAARNQVFTAPTVLFIVDGKEYLRYSRNLSIDELKQKILRIISLYN